MNQVGGGRVILPNENSFIAFLELIQRISMTSLESLEIESMQVEQKEGGGMKR